MGHGTLYGIGVGPGDPELLTLKAVRVLQEVPVIAIPVAQVNGESYALSVVTSYLRPDQELLRLHFPMRRDTVTREAHRRIAADTLAEQLVRGRDVAFLTEGDPLLHSTLVYVSYHLAAVFPVVIVPGITSFSAAAVDARLPLSQAEERLAVLPAVFEDWDELRRTLTDFDTVILLKVQGVLEPLIELLREMDLLRCAVLVERASLAEGRVVRALTLWKGQSVHYLSLLIVRKGLGPLPVVTGVSESNCGRWL